MFIVATIPALSVAVICVEFSDSYGWAGKRPPWGAVTASADRRPNCLLPGSGLQLLVVQLPQPGATGTVITD